MADLDSDLNPVHAAGAGLWDYVRQGAAGLLDRVSQSAGAGGSGGYPFGPGPAPVPPPAQGGGGYPFGQAEQAPSPPRAPRQLVGPGNTIPDPIVLPGSDAGASVGGSGGAPQSVTIPAREVPAVSPERQKEFFAKLKDLQDSYGMQASAARGVAGAEGDAALGQAGAESALASTMGGQAADYLQGVKDRRKPFEEWEARHRGLVDAARSEDETDPYKDLSGIDRIRFGLSGMLGGFMQGWQGGGRNQGLDKMQAEMVARVAAQRAKYERAKYKADEDTKEFDRAYKLTGDLDQASLHTLGVQQEAAAHEARSIGIATGSPVARAKGEAVAAQLETNRRELAVKGSQQGIQMNPYQQARTVTVGGGGRPIKDEERKLLVRLPDGSYVKTNREKEAEDLAGELKSDIRITGLIRHIQALRAEGKQGVLTTEGKKQLESLGAELTLASKEPGVRFTEYEAGMLQSAIGDPSAPAVAVLGNPATDANLARLAGSRAQRAREYAGSQGFPIMQMGYTRDPKTGALVQTGNFAGQAYRGPPAAADVPFTPAK